MRKSIVPAAIALVGGLLLQPVPEAGPVATVTFKDGRTLETEILKFANGEFLLRDRKAKQNIRALDRNIRAIDFGRQAEVIPPPPPPPKIDTTPFWKATRQQRFFDLFLYCRYTVGGRRGKEPVLAFEKELRAKLDDKDLSAEEVRDLGLALSATALGLGELAKGLEALRQVKLSHPTDPVVLKFETRVRNAARRRLRENPPPARPRGRRPAIERKNNDRPR